MRMDLEAVPLPPELSLGNMEPPGGGKAPDPALPARLAARYLRDPSARRSLLANARIQVEAKAEKILALCREALPVEATSTEIELCFPLGAGDDRGHHQAAWIWLQALAAEGSAYPALIEGYPTWSMDGAEGLEDPGVLSDGGGSLDTPGTFHDGGSSGHAGSTDAGGGDFGGA